MWSWKYSASGAKCTGSATPSLIALSRAELKGELVDAALALEWMGNFPVDDEIPLLGQTVTLEAFQESFGHTNVEVTESDANANQPKEAANLYPEATSARAKFQLVDELLEGVFGEDAVLDAS